MKSVLGWMVTTLAVTMSIASVNEWLTFIISLLSIGFLLWKYYDKIKGKPQQHNLKNKEHD